MKYNLSKFAWSLKSTPETDNIATQLKNDGMHHSPAFLRLCASRGIHTKEQLEEATDQQFQMFHDPFLLKDMDIAVERIERAVESNEVILIYGDYDADGITSTLILYEALESIGANVHYYLPNRLTDGYGPNTDRWKSLVDELNVQLFITVDNGIAGFDTIQQMNTLNIDTIVTDHHEIQSELPDAFAIIHPNHPRGNYPFPDLSGAGVSLKLASALLGEIPTEALELAMIGTVADMVDITNENRTIVLSGLNLMKDTLRLGLSMMLEEEKVIRESITTDTIGFIIGPRLNAIGRLGDPTPALELLKTFDEDEARTLLNLINEKNSERQTITKRITSEIEEKLNNYAQLPNIIIEADPQWPAGILGIAASRIVNNYQRPVILFQYIEESKQYKGSSRSVNSINIFEELVKQKDLLTHFGGHSQAAGLTIDEDNWDAFKQKIQEGFEHYSKILEQPEVIEVDISLDVEEVTIDFIEELNLLSPFGTANPKPKFMLKDTQVNNIRRIGVDGDHLKMILGSQKGGSLDSIGFSKADQARGIKEGTNIAIVGELSINEWKGRKSPQVIIDDLGIDGTQWIDYRASTIHPDLLKIKQALYVFRHQRILDFMQANQLIGKDTTLYANINQQNINHFKHLVIMEPPIDLLDLKQVIQSHSWETIYLGSFVHESKYLAGLPSRQDFVQLYKKVYSEAPFNYQENFSVLSKALNFDPVKLKAMFMMFLEAEFVTIENGWLEFNNRSTGSKIDLTNLKTYSQYQNEYHSEALLNYQSLNKVKEYFEGK